MNYDLIEVCARLSVCAYSAEEPGYDAKQLETVYLEDTDTMVRVYQQGSRIIVAVRGTVSKPNWRTNLSAKKKDNVHAGFRSIAEALINPLLNILLDPDLGPYSQVVMTGHSYGGAVATLLAMRLCGPIDALITFGQPRVGSSMLVRESVICSYIRVVNGSDGVTLVPKLGYGHAGTLLYLANDGRRLVDPSWAERGIDMLKDWWHETITDHWMGDYFNRLKGAK